MQPHLRLLKLWVKLAIMTTLAINPLAHGVIVWPPSANVPNFLRFQAADLLRIPHLGQTSVRIGVYTNSVLLFDLRHRFRRDLHI